MTSINSQTSITKVWKKIIKTGTSFLIFLEGGSFMMYWVLIFVEWGWEELGVGRLVQIFFYQWILSERKKQTFCAYLLWITSAGIYVILFDKLFMCFHFLCHISKSYMWYTSYTFKLIMLKYRGRIILWGGGQYGPESGRVMFPSPPPRDPNGVHA